MRRVALGVGVLLALAGCGGAPRSADTLAAELDAMHLEQASRAAPDLVAEARAALADAREAEARGDRVAAADHAALARLHAAAALDEEARLAADTERVALERETLEAETELHALEADATERRADLARLAAARTAREEAARSLVRAEVDEARPGRARHVSLSDPGELRTAARAIRDRARLLAAAATALGAPTAASVDGLLARSEAATDPHESLALADQAYGAARALLAEARRAHPLTDATRIASLVEAAETEGFHALATTRGTAIELEGAFDGAATRASATGERRLARLAQLVLSYPEGPVRVEIDSATPAEAGRTASARAESVVRALVAAGIPASRVSAADPIAPDQTPTPAARVRVLLVAYADTPPPPGGSVPRATAATETEPAEGSAD